MRKNIVICCDGTASEFASHLTNVVKLFYVVERDSVDQIAYYHPGLGTMEPAGALTPLTRKLTKLLGMAVGFGLSDDIFRAYSFLMEHYEDGDQVFLFGFSRGAYTVRAVCSLLYMYGLIRPGNESLVPYAVRMMLAIHRARGSQATRNDVRQRYFMLAEQFRHMMARTLCKPRFVGVWDTVSSVGWIDNPLKLPYIANNPDIEIGRHAVSIDEHRAFFRNHLWRLPDDLTAPRGPKDLKQVWFAGVHCDVGGGYPEKESGLSKIALDWMIQEAKKAGLKVDGTREAEVLGKDHNDKYAAADPDAQIHESLSGAWNLGEFVLKEHYDWATGTSKRRMNLYRRRTLPPNSLVHESVFLRGDEYSSRLPKDVVRVITA
jgi:uncharacterized protein (DUF2235 family)